MSNNAPESLSRKQTAAFTAAELRTIRDAAAESNITAGLFARALLLWAVDNIDRVPALRAAVDAERTAARTRASDGARRAVAQRWNPELTR